MRDDVPLHPGPRFAPISREASAELRRLFEELEFGSLVPRLDGALARWIGAAPMCWISRVRGAERRYHRRVPLRWRAHSLPLTCVVVAAAAALGLGRLTVASAEPPKCSAPAGAPLWPDVAPVFDAHCASCHDSRKTDRRASLAVFDQARYPFETDRPNTLVADLRHMFEARAGISHPDRCKVLAWLAAGAPDASGRKPRFR